MGKSPTLLPLLEQDGTMTGTATYLKEKNKNIHTLAVDSYGSLLKRFKETGEMDYKEVYPYLIEGIGQDIIPGNFDFSVIDYVEQVNDKDAALMCRRLARLVLFTGYSGGAVMQGVLQMADRFEEGDNVVIIFHDHGSRYVGKVYNDDWMRERGFLKDEVITAKSIIERKKDLNLLISASAEDTIIEAFHKNEKEKGLTQLPIIENRESNYKNDLHKQNSAFAYR